MASAMSSAVGGSSDPTAMLNNQLASALSTLGDAQFWEETISPATIRNELSSTDPSNANSTPILLKGMKWLLASISKGRDVSDFYPHVVKLVGAKSLEVRKMVYTYLVQYADHDATTRELSLLSINSFQRGLADHEQLIRALALRVLSSIRIPDILQIQILGVQKCSKDRSPYVRKCAANALAKLNPRCDEMQREMLLDIVKTMLDTDTSTMVLSSAIVAFCELCPERLDLLHSSFRKICHLLTDMDEWGQVVIIDVLARYCRTFFKQPKGWKGGTAEKIDRERRVRRRIKASTQSEPSKDAGANAADTKANGNGAKKADPNAPKKIKRRVVQKGFYSDEEDESTEEEVYADSPLGPAISTASAMRQRNILGVPGVQPIAVNMDADEDLDLDEDHKLLLQSSMPLLKSRNAGVVLSVCSLLYYCGVSSVKTRSAIGKALVRIHRDRREIQYVVLTSIRTLVTQCPSAFAPFLNDFYVKALDPPHTRIIKIDILCSLALEPAAIEVVLKELRTYIRNGDKKFVCAAVRAVGRVAELARIVYDRHGVKTEDAVKERSTANRIALDCLYGLCVVTETCDSKLVVGEAVVSIQNILAMLASDSGASGSLMQVEDPNYVQSFALRRILLLLVQTLSARIEQEEDDNGSNNDDDDDDKKELTELEKVTLELPAKAVASALSTVGDWLSNIHGSSISLKGIDGDNKSKMRLEVLRLLARAFPELDNCEKEHAVHLASKFLVSSASGMAPASATECAMCEHILSMGRVDVNPDVKDRARFESAIIHTTIGLKHDTDALELSPSIGGGDLTAESAKKIFLDKKPAPSFLPIEDDDAVDTKSFRFGTLSSLVSHQARAYLSLPPWSEKNSPKSLRDPIEVAKAQVAQNFSEQPGASGFYGEAPGGDSSSSSDSSDSSSSESSDGQNADSESESDSSDDSSSSSSDDDLLGMVSTGPTQMQNDLLGSNQMHSMAAAPVPVMQPYVSTASSNSSSSSSSSDSSYSSDSSGNYNGDVSSANLLTKQNPASVNLLGGGYAASANSMSTGSSSAMDDLKGLVMSPPVVNKPKAQTHTHQGTETIEVDSGVWMELVRPALCGGLSVMGRYLRGPTRQREAQLKGLDPDNAGVVCVQIQLSNKKTDIESLSSLRRIRIVPRTGSGGSFAVKKALCPPEISELKKGQVISCTICLQFASVSNREGDLVAKLEVKSSTGGSMPFELRPSLGDLLRPHQATQDEFDSTMQRMVGFQRVVSKFQTSNLSALPVAIMKQVALTPVGSLAFVGNKLRLVGELPASTELVLVMLQCDMSSGSGVITVCADNPVAVNSIMSTLKRVIP